MMKQLQQMQDRLLQAQRALEETRVEASAGGGAVTVVMTAQPQVKSIVIKPEVVDPADIEMLRDLITAAINEGLEKVRATQAQQLGGIGIPGLSP